MESSVGKFHARQPFAKNSGFFCVLERRYQARSYFTDYETPLPMNCISRPFLRPL